MSLLNKPASSLLPIDYIFMSEGSHPIEFVFLFESRIDAGRLKIALDDTIPFFHLVSSQLFHRNSEELELRYHPKGLIYDSTIVFDEMVAREPWNYLQSVRTAPGEPLCRIQLTQFADGSALGISISHLVADGFSCFHFLKQLSRAYRGLPVVAPTYRRDWYLPSRSDKALSSLIETLFDKSGLTFSTPRKELPHEAIKRQTLHFSCEFIEELMEEARKTAPAPLSVNDVVTAKLWQTMIPRWHKNDEKRDYLPRLTIPYDVRRLSDWIDPCFFGNAVCLTSAAYTKEGFSAAPLGELAYFVRQMIQRVNRAYVQEAYDLLEDYRLRGVQGDAEQLNLNVMESLHIVDPNDGLMVTNLTRAPIEDLLYTGAPAFRFIPVTRSPRTALLLPDGSGGIVVDLTLPSDADVETVSTSTS